MTHQIAGGGLSLSTMWRAAQSDSGRELLDSMAGSGLNRWELEYRLTTSVLEDLRGEIQAGRLGLSSLHHPCPHPDWLPRTSASGDALPLSSLEEDQRGQAVALGLRSLRLAAELGVGTVVFHLGRVEMDFQRREYHRLLDEGIIQEVRGRQRVDRDRLIRAERAPPHLAAVRRSLDELVPQAERLGVRLGLENRYYPNQIPSLEEMEELLGDYPVPAVGYWHDVGHAEVHAAWGLVKSPTEFLDRLGVRLLGVHLHDVRGSRDHAAPGTGMVDFVGLAPYLRAETIRVLELKEWVTPEEIRAAPAVLEAAGILG